MLKIFEVNSIEQFEELRLKEETEHDYLYICKYCNSIKLSDNGELKTLSDGDAIEKLNSDLAETVPAANEQSKAFDTLADFWVMCEEYMKRTDNHIMVVRAKLTFVPNPTWGRCIVSCQNFVGNGAYPVTGSIIFDVGNAIYYATITGGVTDYSDLLATWDKLTLNSDLALIDNRTAIADLIAEADKGISATRIVLCDSSTLNTPYKDGLTGGRNTGIAYINMTSANYGNIVYYDNSTNIYVKSKAGSGNWSDWARFALASDLSNYIPLKEIAGTLAAGSTSITLSSSSITTSSTIDIYTDTFGVNPTGVTVTAGSVTLTFKAQTSAVGVKVRVS